MVHRLFHGRWSPLHQGASLFEKGEKLSTCGLSVRNPFSGAAFTCSLWLSTAHIVENSQRSASRELFLLHGGKLRQSEKEPNSVGQQVGAATKGPFLPLLGSWGLHRQRTLALSPFVQFILGLLSRIMK